MADPYVPPPFQNGVDGQDERRQSDSDENASNNGISLQPTFGTKEENDTQYHQSTTAQQKQYKGASPVFHAMTNDDQDRATLLTNNNNNNKNNNIDNNNKTNVISNMQENNVAYDDSTYLLQHPTNTKDLFGCSHLLVVPLFFTMSFFTYFDRGTLSASLDKIQSQLLNDSSFESGALASAYLFGYCLSSPFFALMGSYYPPIRMSAAGMFVWSIGCAFTGILSDFYLLLIARLLTGIGEASFLSFSSTIIDTIVPTESRSRWLGFFYMAIPLGYAFGDGIGGVIADIDISFFETNGNSESWRLTFLIEFVVMIPLIGMMLFMKSPPNMLVIKEIKGGASHEKPPNYTDNDDEQEPADDPWNEKLLRIVTNKTWLAATGGYATQTFVTGTFAVEAITYLQKVYGQSSGEAGTIVGVITFTTGVLGSIFGGVILDKLKAKVEISNQSLMALDINPNEVAEEHHHHHHHSVNNNEQLTMSINNNDNNDNNLDRNRSNTVDNAAVDNVLTDYVYVGPALSLLTVLSLIAFPAGFIAFIFHNVYLFYSLLGFAEFFIFASQGPVNNAVLWCSLYRDRPLAAAINTLCIHLFGDALAPLLIGWIVDYQESQGKSESDSYNFAMGIASWWLLLSVICFFMGRYTLAALKKYMQYHERLDHAKKKSTMK